MPTDKLPSSQPLLLSTRLARSDISGIGKADTLRKRAKALKNRVSSGGYGQNDLEEFWSIISNTPNTLGVSSSQLSEASDGMTAHFFSSVVRDRRSPKLTNMLKALAAVVSIADERLADIDEERAKEAAQSETGWIANPIYLDREAIENAERSLRDIIEFLNRNNSLSNIHDVDEYWRSNLINTLETALALLKAPLIEKSIFRSSAEGLKKLSVKIAGDSSAGFFGGLTGAAATYLLQLLGMPK